MRREEFFARIAARLGPRSEEHAADSLATGEPSSRATREPSSPRTTGDSAPSSRGELAARFERELARVGGAVRRVDGPAGLAAEITRFLEESGARTLVAFERAAFAGLGLEALLDSPALATPSAPDFRARAAAADAGLSIADLGVAASGSMLFSATPDRPRATTLLPGSHVAILRASAIVPDLAAAFRALAARGPAASSSIFVTGPSRTSDIENDLTLGVHGPAAVTVFLLQD